MKKIAISIVAAAAVLLFALPEATAQHATENQKPVENVHTGFVDQNGDGVCDHYDGKRPGKGQGPGFGQGEGRANGKSMGQRKGLRDGSGKGERKLDGSGPRKGMRRGLRNGSGPNCAGTKVE